MKMKAAILSLIFVAALFALPARAPAAEPAGEVRMLDSATADAVVPANGNIVKITMPLALTAHDLITKVYGFIDPGSSRSGCTEAAKAVTAITPEEDDFGLWMHPGIGYSISYFGMEPDVEAMAQFSDEDRVSNFGYIFFFPYKSGKRSFANADQADFCGCLLQELSDMGLDMMATPFADGLFEAVGDYAGNSLIVRLIEEVESADGTDTAPHSDALSSLIESSNAGKNASGQFVVLLTVEPGAFNEQDNEPAADYVAMEP